MLRASLNLVTIKDMSHEFLNFILALAIIVLAAKAGGYLSGRFGQPG